jgi:hypothetical protein
MDTNRVRSVGANLSRVAVIALAAFGAYALVDARQGPSGPPPFTAADRLEIHELLHRYMFVLDSCPDHGSGYEYADLYTEDGQFGRATRGREALARAAGRTSDGNCSEFRKRGAMNQVHVNVSPIVEPTPDGNARGISYLLMMDGPAHEIYWNGWYQDVYARTPKGWRFKSRSHVGGTRAGVPADLSAARALWEREPTPAGSRSLLAKAKPDGQPRLAEDPLKWLASGRPSVPD